MITLKRIKNQTFEEKERILKRIVRKNFKKHVNEFDYNAFVNEVIEKAECFVDVDDYSHISNGYYIIYDTVEIAGHRETKDGRTEFVSVYIAEKITTEEESDYDTIVYFVG